MVNVLDDTARMMLADVCANPEDDTPRLVFADWCEDNGHHLRSEFIRTQIEMAKVRIEPWASRTSVGELREKAERLLQLQARREDSHPWFIDESSSLKNIRLTFWRGFVEIISIDGASWIRLHEQIRATNPIKEVGFTSLPRISVYLDGPGGWGGAFVEFGVRSELKVWREKKYPRWHPVEDRRPTESQALVGLLRENWPNIDFFTETATYPHSRQPLATKKNYYR